MENFDDVAIMFHSFLMTFLQLYNAIVELALIKQAGTKLSINVQMTIADGPVSIYKISSGHLRTIYNNLFNQSFDKLNVLYLARLYMSGMRKTHPVKSCAC